MRTTLDLDPKLLEDVVKATGQKSKTRAVSKALEDYIRDDRLRRLLRRQGKLDLALDDWYEFRHMER
jgi:Arc/MetJ family transcription regulator